MKWKLIPASLSMACASLVTWGQEFGVKAGLNLSDVVITNYINPDAESDYRMKPGLHAGAYVLVHLTDKVSMTSELLYSNRGVNAGDRINLHYVTVPILTLYELSRNFVIEFGPEVGYLFVARSRYGDVSNTWNNKLDIGLDAGCRVTFSRHFGAGLRYYAGFSSVIDSIDERDTNNVPTGEVIKYQNRVLQLSLYYRVKEIAESR